MTDPATLERWAREACFRVISEAPDNGSIATLARFAELVRADALEQAAQECEQLDATHPQRIAAAIRALKDAP